RRTCRARQGYRARHEASRAARTALTRRHALRHDERRAERRDARHQPQARVQGRHTDRHVREEAHMTLGMPTASHPGEELKQSALRQLDSAAKALDLDPGMHKFLRTPERTLIV